MRATFAYADWGVLTSSQYRVIIPANALRAAGHEIVLVETSRFSVKDKSETILVEREIFPPLLKLLRSMGIKRIIVSFDDAYHKIRRDSIAWNFWRGEKRMLNPFREALRQVEGAIVPSRNLARDFGVSFLPNYLDDGEWAGIEADVAEEGDPIRIGWGGSHMHKMTWENPVFSQALADLVRDFPKVSIKVYGVLADESLHRLGVPFSSETWIDWKEWPAHVQTFDIGIAPLSGDYDLCRSNVKVLEYAAAGVPWVATNGGEYPSARGGILVDNTRRSWYEALRALVTDRALRHRLAGEGRAWAKTQMMSQHVAEYERLLWPEVCGA